MGLAFTRPQSHLFRWNLRHGRWGIAWKSRELSHVDIRWYIKSANVAPESGNASEVGGETKYRWRFSAAKSSYPVFSPIKSRFWGENQPMEPMEPMEPMVLKFPTVRCWYPGCFWLNHVNISIFFLKFLFDPHILAGPIPIFVFHRQFPSRFDGLKLVVQLLVDFYSQFICPANPITVSTRYSHLKPYIPI